MNSLTSPSPARRRRPPAVAVGLLGALCLLWAGCASEEESPADTKMPEGASEPKEAPRPVPQDFSDPVKDDYSYNAIGKRDPFRSFINRDVVAPIGSGDQLTPLQMWELEQFRLVAIVWGGGEPVAMVQDPESVGHVITVDTLIGKRWGKVTQIKPDQIIVTEQYRDEIENRLIVNEIVVKLPTPEQVGGRG